MKVENVLLFLKNLWHDIMLNIVEGIDKTYVWSDRLALISSLLSVKYNLVIQF